MYPASAYSSDKSRPTSCIQLLVAVCIGMVHMIFSESSQGTHTAHNEIFKLTYIQFMFCIYIPCWVHHKSFRTHVIILGHTKCTWYIVRRFNHHICMCLCIFVVLAHVSQRLICEIGYNGHFDQDELRLVVYPLNLDSTGSRN